MSTKQDHKRWRKQFNEDCLKRDKNKCVFCEVTENLDVHHITDRHEIENGGYVVSNGITLCDEHHKIAERFHQYAITLPGFYPDELYEKIGSSHKQAILDSQNLN